MEPSATYAAISRRDSSRWRVSATRRMDLATILTMPSPRPPVTAMIGIMMAASSGANARVGVHTGLSPWSAILGTGLHEALALLGGHRALGDERGDLAPGSFPGKGAQHSGEGPDGDDHHDGGP